MRRQKNSGGASPSRQDYPMLRPWADAPHRMNEAGVRWLQSRRLTVKDSTYIKYELIWRRHIDPALGRMSTGDVSTQVVEAFTRRLLEQGLAVKTIHDVLTVLRSVLAYAVGQGWAVPSHLDFRAPREPRKPIRVLSRQEQDRLVRFLYEDMDCCRFGVLLALLTGMRLGELCALRWANISMSQQVILIDATMQRLRVLDEDGEKKTHVVVGSPKSVSAVRAIPMSEHVAALCRQMEGCGPECFVLTGTERYMEPRVVQLRLKKYAQACGLEGVHFHTLRHTFATRSVEVGFELKSLSEVLGHANTSVTLNLYVHASMDLKRTNMNKLAQAGL